MAVRGPSSGMEASERVERVKGESVRASAGSTEGAHKAIAAAPAVSSLISVEGGSGAKALAPWQLLELI